jgi:hypothetical protein
VASARRERWTDEERAAVAARSTHHCLLPKLLLLVLLLLGLLLVSLPSLHSLVLLRELMPAVAFYGVQTHGRVRERGRKEVAALIIVPRGEWGGAEGR